MNRTESSEVRLLPLVENSPNEGVANLLARMLVDDPAQAAQGAQSALLILIGLQAFLDSGDYLAAEQVWEPVIVMRQMEKAYGPNACSKAIEMSQAARATSDERGASIYERVAAMLQPNVNKC